jgi:undecaprenyl-diphosphatase
MNYHLFRTINDWSGNGFLDDLMKVVAKDAIFAVVAAFVVLLGYRLRERDPLPVLFSVGALAAAFGFAKLAAVWHSEARPWQTHEVHHLIAGGTGNAFPSKYATAAFGVAFVTLLFLSRSWGLLLTLVALAIGFSRVYVGVHYPGDILAGAVAAVLGVVVAVGVAQPRKPAPSPYPPVGAARR